MHLKIKHIYLFISCMFLLLGAERQAVAQSNSGVSGIVVTKGGSTRLGEVNVTNLRTNRRTQTNTFGVFIIEASVGDSLSFTKTGYGPVKTVLQTQEDILIEMQEGLTLETVVVSRMSKEAEMRDMLDDYRKKGVYNGGKNTVGTYLGSPATALYNLFGRDAKNAKRFAKLMDRELEESKVDRIFNKSSVGALTDLEGDELQSFMDLYRPSYSMVEHWGQYDFMNYVKTSLEAWNKNGRPRSSRLPKLEIPPQER
ncbi:hypothetical protein BC792_1092 [Sphingobacterium allocomposti]|jgi:hypothetical protein|uniref:Carboxypeptidase-like protein n=1 Tax=Sphingobacterium allocomposti TaxID=415956 RepID=A0A5S5DKZ4_9SPHI|nr:hypothetical protein [Sphingobacterium composti Yoo et al. 2007 non Ten et al. 2007]TYP95806.1 hypothetical protein BC792_1092 [Sphingobacterium composti Yoo et al. 2007 non Ten et al. 2007]HLS95126.1 hypothetical protein [Sphingobacterium sp.]